MHTFDTPPACPPSFQAVQHIVPLTKHPPAWPPAHPPAGPARPQMDDLTGFMQTALGPLLYRKDVMDVVSMAAGTGGAAPTALGSSIGHSANAGGGQPAASAGSTAVAVLAGQQQQGGARALQAGAAAPPTRPAQPATSGPRVGQGTGAADAAVAAQPQQAAAGQYALPGQPPDMIVKATRRRSGVRLE